MEVPALSGAVLAPQKAEQVRDITSEKGLAGTFPAQADWGVQH